MFEEFVVVSVIDVEDWLGFVYNEEMDEIWLEVESDDLGVNFWYGRCGDKFYQSVGGGYWSSIYRDTYEDFLKYIEECSVFNGGSSLVKIK